MKQPSDKKLLQFLIARINKLKEGEYTLELRQKRVPKVRDVFGFRQAKDGMGLETYNEQRLVEGEEEEEVQLVEVNGNVEWLICDFRFDEPVFEHYWYRKIINEMVNTFVLNNREIAPVNSILNPGPSKIVFVDINSTELAPENKSNEEAQS